MEAADRGPGLGPDSMRLAEVVVDARWSGTGHDAGDDGVTDGAPQRPGAVPELPDDVRPGLR